MVRVSVTLLPVRYSPLAQVSPVALDTEDEVDEVKHMMIVPGQVLQDVRCTVHVDKMIQSADRMSGSWRIFGMLPECSAC